MKWIDKYSCLLEGDGCRRDALWRTSLAWLCYPDEEWPKMGIKNCEEEGRYFRHPEVSDEDTSRDQVIMMTVAYLLNEGYIPELTYRISEKFTMSTAWMWYLALWGNKWAGRLFKLCSLFDVWFMPRYAQHLWSWMVYTLPGEHKLMNKIGLYFASQDNNLLFKLLHDKEVVLAAINNYVPHNDFRWQRNINKLDKGIRLDPTPSEEFPIDKDILYRIWKEKNYYRGVIV